MRSWRTLIHVPLIARPRTAATELISVRLAKRVTPLAEGFIRHPDATFTEELFDIPEAQTKPKVQPYGVAEHLSRKAVILICGGSRRCIHGLITSYKTPALQASQEVDNALRDTKNLGAKSERGV
jgi:hypothetical protein